MGRVGVLACVFALFARMCCLVITFYCCAKTLQVFNGIDPLGTSRTLDSLEGTVRSGTLESGFGQDDEH